MSKTKLLFDLIVYANTKRNFTAQQVADEFNLSVRTAHRYLLELSDMGVPIYTEQGRNGGYRTLENRTLPPILFNEDEAFSIFFAFRSLDYYRALPFKVNMDSVSRKLYASFPKDKKAKIDRLESVLLFWNQKRTVHSHYLQEIIEASLEDHIASINYRSASENKMKEVKPLGVYASNGFWYMPAFDMEYETIRVFRVDRILEFETTKRILKLEMNLHNWLADYTIDKPVQIHVKLTREGIRQCQSEPWIEPSIVTTNDDSGYIHMEIDQSDLNFMSDFFFNLGTDAEVIEPDYTINYIKERAKSLFDHYS